MENMIKALIERNHTDAQTLAAKCNISESNMQNYINNPTFKVPVKDAKKIAGYFNVDYRFVLGLDFKKKIQFEDLHYDKKSDIINERQCGNYGIAKILEYKYCHGYYTDDMVVEEPKQTAFIVMSFKFKKYPELCNIRDTFKEAIRDTGFIPIIISDVRSNNYITLEIMNAINNCTFLVLDTTHENYGAYYEAGFAKGLKKEVIICCRKERFNKRKDHFDVNQIKHILWSDFDELKKELTAQIHATVLKDISALKETDEYEYSAAWNAQNINKQNEAKELNDEITKYAKK